MDKLLKIKNEIDAQLQAHFNSDKIYYYNAQRYVMENAVMHGAAFGIGVCKYKIEQLFMYCGGDLERKRGWEDLIKILETLDASCNEKI